MANNTPTPPAMLDQARSLADCGFYLFPVSRATKKPALKGWQSIATRDPQQLAGWFADSGRYFVGIAGARFGDVGESLLILDCDDEDAVDYIELSTELGMLPVTRVHATPSGGQHYIFRTSQPVKNSTTFRKDGLALDVRGAGGLVVAAGRTAKGEYRPLVDAPVAQAPRWLVERCGESKPADAPAAPVTNVDQSVALQRAEDYLESLGEVPIGQRNNTLNRAGAIIRSFGLAYENAAPILQTWGESQGLEPGETAATIRSVYTSQKIAEGANSQEATRAAFDVVETPTPDRGRFTLLSCEPGAGSRASPLRLVKGLLGEGGCSVWTGDPDAGKSTVLIDLSLHVLHGRPWFGRKVTQGAVLYLAFERAAELPSKVDAFYKEHPDLATDRAPFRYLDLAGIKLTRNDVHAGVLEAVRQVEADANMPVRLIVVDTLRRAMSGDENSSKDFDAFMTALHKIRTATGAHMAVAHHFGKAKNGPRGTSAIVGDFDAAFELENWRIRSDKIKGQKGDAIAYDLPVVALGNDEDDDAITQVVVRPGRPQQIAEVFVDPGKQPGKALAVLRELCDGQGTASDDGFPGIPGRSVACKVWERACRGRLTEPGSKPKSESNAFDRAMRTLLDAGAIREHGGFVGLVENAAAARVSAAVVPSEPVFADARVTP